MWSRPAMLFTSGQIFYDYFPFGCGLGSFGTFASAEYYSPIYEMYGLNHIWGLSKNMPIFICDAFYPELAQFGIIGAILYFFLVYNYPEINFPEHTKEYLYLDDLHILSY